MSERNTRCKCSQRRAERGGGVSLDDEQFRGRAKKREHGRGDRADMRMRLVAVYTAEMDARKTFKSERAWLEHGILTRQDQAWPDAARFQRTGDWLQLESFRLGPNDQPDIGCTQASP